MKQETLDPHKAFTPAKLLIPAYFLVGLGTTILVIVFLIGTHTISKNKDSSMDTVVKSKQVSQTYSIPTVATMN